MSKIATVLALAIGVMAMPAGAAVPPRITGQWEVVGVAVVDGPVQALTRNDPSYMGRRLTFGPQRLAWDTPKNTTENACVKPAITAVPNHGDPASRALVRGIGGPAVRAFAVSCAGGSSWGPTPSPGATLLALPRGTLGLWWYDGGLLKLRRVG